MSSVLSLFPNEPETERRPDLPVVTPKVVIVVYGEAAPAGSKRTVPVRRRDGSTFYQPIDANPKAKKWKDHVANTAGQAMGERALLRGALEVTFTFFKRRPKGHLRSDGTVRPGAPTYPTTRPDTTKLIRGVEDALSGVVWADDSQLVAQAGFKVFGEPERCVIVVREIAP